MHWSLLLEKDLITLIQIQNEAVCTSQNTNVIVKGMHLTILLSAMGK